MHNVTVVLRYVSKCEQNPVKGPSYWKKVNEASSNFSGFVSYWGDTGKHLISLYEDKPLPRCPLPKSPTGSFLFGMTYYCSEI